MGGSSLQDTLSRCLPEGDTPAGAGDARGCVSRVSDCPMAIPVFM